MDRRITTLQFLDVCSPPVAEVFHYWDRKRGGRVMPLRADIDPNEMRRHLTGIVLVEVKRDPLDFVYRLVGTREVAARGNDPTGKRVAENWVGSSAQDVVANYARVVESRSFLYDFDKFVRPGGRRVQDESLFLPLATDGEAVGQIMVYSFYGDSWAGSRPTAQKLLPVIDE
ncbi:MAG: PAS domain-containing protein [Rhodospirillales bacterium]|nr:PAS domain-containing protein [Rhodospirillales bacterium]